MLVENIKSIEQGRIVTIDGGEHWITIKKEGSEGPGRRVLLDKDGNIIGGDLPKEARGKHISSWHKENGTSHEEKQPERPKVFSMAVDNIPSSKIRENLISKDSEYRTKLDTINKQIRQIESEITTKCNQAKEKSPETYWEDVQNGNWYKDLWKQKNKLSEEHKGLSKEKKQLFLNSMLQPKENIVSVDIEKVYGMKDIDRNWAEKTLTELLQYLHKDCLKESHYKNKVHTEIYFNPGIRSYCSNQRLYLGGRDKDSLIHEFGHKIEEENPKIQTVCRDFRNRRTKDSVIEKLSSASKIKSYDPTEITRKDKFFNPYVGKIYSSRDTEILSMGLEAIMKDPSTFAKKDPEHFDLICDIMRGKI